MSRAEDEALYGGAAGGGKSDALVMEGLRQIQIPHYKGLLVRKTFPQLAELIDKSYKYYPFVDKKARYNSSEHTWRFSSGSKIRFGSMHHPSDMYQYQGQAYDYIGFDELTHFTREEYEFLKSRNRANGPGTRCYIRATANPGGVGHGWVKERFIDAGRAGETLWERVEVNMPDGSKSTRWMSRVFIQATLFDNPALLANDPNYLTRLASLPNAEREALLYGNWDSFSGQYFSEWKNDPEHYIDRRWTHVIEPFEVPEHWRIYRSYDFGIYRPFSCGWWTISPDGVLYRILEYYGWNGTPNEGLKWPPEKQFAEIKRIENEHRWLRGKRIFGVADPAIWNNSTGTSVAENAEKFGIYFDKGDNSRIIGWGQVKNRLQFDEEGRARMYIFNNCKQTIRTMPALVHSQTMVEDLDSEGEDHCLVGSTQVLTDKGYRSIESLAGTEGRVVSHDGNYHRYYDARLTRKQSDILSIVLDDGTKICCTYDHRFMDDSGAWIRAKYLHKGIMLKNRTGSRIKSVTYAGKSDVFNMEVEDTHSFVIQGGVISHNCADEIRYMCMAHPVPALILPERKVVSAFDPFDFNRRTSYYY